MANYVQAGGSLPQTLDVQINVNNAQQEAALNLSIPCVVSENLGLLPNANRIRFYAYPASPSVGNDFGTTSEPYLAALAFDSQSPRPSMMAVAEVWLDPIAAQLVASPMAAADITALQAITAGNLLLTLTAQLNTSSIAGAATGTFDSLETVTQGTSGATALVIGAVPGAGPMIVANITGTPDNTHTWTGGTSHATFVPTSVAISTGNSVIETLAYALQSLNFSADTTLTQIASTIQGKLTSGSVPASCSVVTMAGGVQQIVIATTLTGDLASISYPITTGTGTFAGTALKMTSATGGTALPGYAPTDIGGELTNVQNSANASGQFNYGWVLGATLRVPSIQATAATWALAQQYAFMPLVSNDPNAEDPSYTSDLGSLVDTTTNKRILPIYHDNIQTYPDMSILAFMLSVNYNLEQSTVVAMFKQLPGISPISNLDVTAYNALVAKGYNVYANMGSGIFAFRTGNVPASGWWMDTVINIDNFVNELATAEYNVFLRNGKVAFTTGGQLRMVDGAVDIGNKYIYNGAFADRQVPDSTQKSGYSVVKAVQWIPQPIWQATSAQRTARIGTPIQGIVQDAGAMQQISLNIQLVE